MEPGSKNFRSPIMLCALALLSACGGGGGSGVNSTPTPVPTPSPPPPPPVATNYDTVEYRRSNGAVASGAITAWDNGATGQGISVGVIDTGIDISSPEFAGRISSASAAFGGNSSYQDEDGHGTAVTGILAAARNNSEIMGVAFNATIISLRADHAGSCATTDGCTFNDSDIAAALNRATDSRARVVNISLGGADGITPFLRMAVDRATRAGIILVISAGNERDKSPPDYDPSSPSPFALQALAAGNGLVVIANSVDSNGQISAFSDLAGSAQNWVIGALGEHVRSLDLKNDPNTYYLYSGTSFSAPLVAGAAALLAQAFPNLTSAQIVNLLLNSATDAGATGTDNVYGRGILNIAGAFAPAGTTSLGESAVPVSLTSNGTLSAAMGDAARSAGSRAVAIDSLGRAYAIDLKRTLSISGSRPVLTPLVMGSQHQATLENGTFSAHFNFASSASSFNRFGEPLVNNQSSRASGSFSLLLGPSTSVSMAFGTRLSGIARPDAPAGFSQQGYLAARSAEQNFGFEVFPDVAFAMHRRLGNGFSLDLLGESGSDGTRQYEKTAQISSQDHYNLVSARFTASRGGTSFTLSASMLRENEGLLGARFAQLFGVASGRTLFADARADIALFDSWSLSLAARRGWTSAAGTGSANVQTVAWSADIARPGLLHSNDRFGLRISQPLRVTSGGINALLPIAYDYTTRESAWRVTRLDLSPSGQEIDAEMSYARPLAGGWISLNSYWRRQPGNISWANDDIGGAVRFNIGYKRR